MSEQDENLERVSERIGGFIRDFVYEQGIGTEFYMETLYEYVRNQTQALAPASTDRIFRDLRQQGYYDYVVVRRRDSLYRITAILPGNAVVPSAVPSWQSVAQQNARSLSIALASFGGGLMTFEAFVDAVADTRDRLNTRQIP